jgi:hypothetical protein
MNYAHLTFTELEIHIEATSKQLDELAGRADVSEKVRELKKRLHALTDELNERRDHLLK